MMTKTFLCAALACLIAHSSWFTATCQPIESSSDEQLVRLRLFKTINKNSIDSRFQQHFLSLDGANETAPGSPRRQPLLRADKIAYHTEIFLGEPAQKFLVLIDTGSSDLWVPSIQCEDEACAKKKLYDSSGSSKSKRDGRNVVLHYGNGLAIAGKLSIDQFEFAGVKVDEQTFVEGLQIAGDVMNMVAFDGVLGIGNRARSLELVHKSPMQSILDSGAFREKVFSFKMLPTSHVSDLEPSGELIVGGLDHSLYTGEITWSPLTRLSNWEFRIDSIELRHPTGVQSNATAFLLVCEEGCLAVPDTGTALIAGHPPDIMLLNQKIGALPVGAGLYAFEDCHLGLMPNLVITISGRDFVLTPEMYVERRPEGCFSALRVVGMLPHWILGDTFLDNFFTAFDLGNKRIGFADLKR